MKQFEVYADLIGKYLAGEMNPEERDELLEWVNEKEENRKFYTEIKEVWEKSDGVEPPPFEADLESAWAKIDLATNGQTDRSGQSPARTIPLSKKIARWSIAAAILMLLGLGLWWVSQPPPVPLLVEIQTIDGEKQELLLPDGSRVWLNEKSRMTYSEDFNPRQVTLAGEAFFSVERQEENPFRITSGEAITTVLGTSFTVRAYPEEDRVEVTVETGKVALAVTKQEVEPVILPAGTSGIVYKAEQKVEAIDKMDNAAAWKTLRLEFEDEPMEEVITVLERYFDAEINVSDAGMLKCLYSSAFDQPDLESILSVIGATFGFEVSRVDAGYLLVGQGCQPSN